MECQKKKGKRIQISNVKNSSQLFKNLTMYSSKYSVQLDIIEDKSFIINTKKITNAKCTTEVQ